MPRTSTITARTPAERLAVEKALTALAASGQVLDSCEEAAVAKGREFTLAMLQQTLQPFVEAQEKKALAWLLRRFLLGSVMCRRDLHGEDIDATVSFGCGGPERPHRATDIEERGGWPARGPDARGARSRL